MVTPSLKLEGTPISTLQKTFLLFVSGGLTAVIVFIFLYIWDGENWRFTESGLLANIAILAVMGFAFAILYFGKEFKRINDKVLIIDDKQFTFKQGVKKTVYTIDQIDNIRYDRLFYLFIGYERITLTFVTTGLKRKAHEVMVFKKGVYADSKTMIINHLKTVEAHNTEVSSEHKT